MARFAEGRPREILQFQDQVRDALMGSASFQEAAQRVVDCFWSVFADSIVLVRFFATVPYARLSAADRAFVDRTAASLGSETLMRDETLILSLLGTRGVEPEWNDRLASRGHLAIPLLSPRFIDSLPMVARLLHELKVEVGAFEGEEDFVEVRLSAGQVGIFYVRDAATATDQQGRRIISAQDFVARYQVKTVFGLGGVYTDGTIPVILVFTRDHLDREMVSLYTHLVTLVKAATTELLRSGAWFAETGRPNP